MERRQRTHGSLRSSVFFGSEYLSEQLSQPFLQNELKTPSNSRLLDSDDAFDKPAVLPLNF